ncbi:MAG: hypothetical protein ACOC3J_07365 [Gemmatimonadota bacterium]
MMVESGPAHGPSHDPVVEQTGFRFGWAAALAGIVIAVALQAVLALLGIAIGFTWWSPDSAGSLSMAAGVWTLISWILALFLGAMVAGRLAGILTRGDGALHGLVIWAGSVFIAGFMLLSGAGFLAGTAFDLLSRAVSATASAAVSGVTQLASQGVSQLGSADYGALESDIERLLRETEAPGLQPDTLAALGEEAGERVTGEESSERVAREITEQIERTAGRVDREAVLNVLVAETGLSRSEAENVASRVERLGRQAGQAVETGLDTLQIQARETADSLGDNVGSAAWWVLLSLLLSAGGAVLGGMITARS